MPAPLLSPTAAPENSMFSMRMLLPAVTQIPLPSAASPSATRCARPPTPRMVRLFAFHTATSPVYVPASISIVSPSFAWSAAAWIVLISRDGPTFSTRPLVLGCAAGEGNAGGGVMAAVAVAGGVTPGTGSTSLLARPDAGAVGGRLAAGASALGPKLIDSMSPGLTGSV